MTINRVTQNMMTDRSLSSLQLGLGRLAKTQEQLSTGRVLNRPSDSPTDTTSAMRMRSSLADQQQYVRSAEDGMGWLQQIDDTLTGALGQVRLARETGQQGLNAVAQGAQAREALAAQVDQLRSSLLGAANATYLDRPVFGGLVSGSTAYDATGTFVGVTGDVSRTVGKGVKMPVNADGPAVFGPNGANLFTDLAELSAALRTGDVPVIQAKLTALDAVQARFTETLSDVGTRANRLERAAQAARDLTLNLTASLSEIENVDLPRATMDLKMHELSYQAALAATARLVQPSLVDFLR